jgi:hypothetical protein
MRTVRLAGVVRRSSPPHAGRREIAGTRWLGLNKVAPREPRRLRGLHQLARDWRVLGERPDQVTSLPPRLAASDPEIAQVVLIGDEYHFEYHFGVTAGSSG